MFAAPLSAQDLGIEVGCDAPAVVVQSLRWEVRRSGTYIGKTPMLIEFWATWCPNCVELMPTLLDAEKKYGKRSNSWILRWRSTSLPEKVRRFLAANPLPHETLLRSGRKGSGCIRRAGDILRSRFGQVGQSGLYRPGREAGSRRRAQEGAVTTELCQRKRPRIIPRPFLFRRIRFRWGGQTVHYCT